MFDAVIQGSPRTNNAVEGWHRAFNSALGANHVTVWKFINMLKREQSLQEAKMEQRIAGVPQQKKRRKYKDLDERNTLDKLKKKSLLIERTQKFVKKYKQPIAYFFCQGSTNSHRLSKMIKNVICEVYSTGLHVVATIRDQGATNEAAIKNLNSVTKAHYLRQNKEYRDDMYEIQSIRNNLLTKNFIFTIDNITYEAKWQHIVDSYRKDSEKENLKMLPWLTDNHVITQKISKMKMNCAAPVLQIFFFFFDQLFDSVNGSYNKIVDGKKYRTAITMISSHFDLWEKSLPVLHSMIFIDSKSQKRPKPPTVKNWEKTIRDLKVIITFLHSKGIKSVLPRNPNQDSLENFFDSSRSIGCRNNNPSCTSFSASYKTLLLNNLMSTHSPGSNCEDDLATSCLTSYQHLFDNSTSERGEGNDSTSEVAESVVSAETVTDNLIKQPEDWDKNLSIANLSLITGKIVKKIQSIKETIFKICILINLNLLTKKHNFKTSLVKPSLHKIENNQKQYTHLNLLTKNITLTSLVKP
ncbi:hypothetical protein QTP88_000808 [Uroleucon formosanum]